MMKTAKKGRSRRGFTLTEVLTTVGLLIILLAIAIPSVVTARNNLRMTALDDTARQIYVAAQNQLTSYKSTGRLKEVTGSSLLIMSEPSDFPDEVVFKPTNYIYYLSGAPGIDDILPPNAIDAEVRSNYYVIEVNRATGTVYSVFYAEDAAIPYPDFSGSFSEADYRADLAARKSKGLKAGYYGGRFALDSITVETSDDPTFELINEEDLYIKLTTAPGVSYHITVADSNDSSKFFEYDLPIGAGDPMPGNVSVSGNETKIILDSLASGKHFKDIAAGFGIAPGANLTVTVEAIEPGKLSAAQSKEANSLFAKVVTDTSLGSPTNTASVAYGRHLQNLEPGVSGMSQYLVQKVVQTKDIDWSAVYSTAFQCVHNDEINSYNGNGNVIKNIILSKDDKVDYMSKGYVSIFAYFKGSLSNVMVVDPKLIGSGNANIYISTLVGYGEDIVASNCQVYTTGTGISLTSNSKYVGGMFGTLAGNNVSVTQCSVSLPLISGSGNSNIGGLIYEITGGGPFSLTNCYTNFGYAGNNIYNLGVSSQNFGGLIANAGAPVSITTCFAVACNKTAYPLCLTTGKSAALNSYAVQVSSTGGVQTRVYKDNADGGGNGQAIPALADLYTNLHLGVGGTPFIRAGSGTTSAYYATLQNENYPYPMVAGLHYYGDWPVQTVADIQLYKVPEEDDTALREKPAEEDRIYYVVVPAGGSASFDVLALTADGKNALRAAELTPEMDIAANELLTSVEIAEALDNQGCTTVTVKAPANKNGLTQFDLAAGGAVITVAVVVADAELTLTGTPASTPANKTENSLSTWHLDPAATTPTEKTLKLGAGDTSAFVAKLTVKPSQAKLAADMNTFTASSVGYINSLTGEKRTETPDTATRPTPTADDWGKLVVYRKAAPGDSKETEYVYGPGVIKNDDMALLRAAGSTDQYPFHYNNGGTANKPAITNNVNNTAAMTSTSPALNLVGVDSGDATLAVSWAVCKELTVKLPVEITGPQVLLTSLLSGGQSAVSGANPYQLNLTLAEGQTTFNLNIESALLFSEMGSAGTYTWTLTGDGTTYTGTPSGANAVFSNIPAPGAKTTYRLKVTYTAGTYKTSDFAYVTVTPVATVVPTSYGDITGLPTGTVTLEQIPGSTGANQRVFTAQATGDVPGLRWYYSMNADGSGEMLVSQTDITSVVTNASGTPIATIKWVDDDAGGVVTVTATDTGNLDEENFYLVAKTMSDVAPQTSIVPVKIYPRLVVNPETVRALATSNTVTFAPVSANRSDVTWSATNTATTTPASNAKVSGVVNGDNNYTVKLTNVTTPSNDNQNVPVDIVATAGPYVVHVYAKTAYPEQYQFGQNFGGSSATYFINGDRNMATVLPVEKGTTNTMIVLWKMEARVYTNASASKTASNFDIGASNLKFDSNSGGIVTLPVTGKALSQAAASIGFQMSWKGSWTGWLTGTDRPSFDVWVSGIEASENITIDPQSANTGTVSFASSFSTALASDGEVTFTVSNPEVISVSGTGVTYNEATGVGSYTANGYVEKNLTVTQKRHGQALISASYAVGGHTYTDAVKVTVLNPDPEAVNVVMQTCSMSDRPILEELFEEPVPYVYSYDADRPAGSDKLTIYNGTSLYLKVYAEDAAHNPVVSSELAKVYLASNAYYANVTYRTKDMKYYYIKVTGKNPTVSSQIITVSAEFNVGGEKRQVSEDITVVSPIITLKKNGADVAGYSIDGTTGSFTLTAARTPRLVDQSGNDLGDNIFTWKVEDADGNWPAGVTLSATTGNTVTVTVDPNKKPKSRVAVRVNCGTAAEGYSLVFKKE